MSELSRFSPQTARLFADKYSKATSEKQLAQSFWRDFFYSVCGITDLLSSGIEFEYPVRSHIDKTIKFIDVLWTGVLLIEHKSFGKDLDKAEEQARNYLISLDARLRPPVFIVSDFARIRIVDVFAGKSVEFELNELPENLGRIEDLLGSHIAQAIKKEVSVDSQAAKLMSNLFIEFEKAGYEGHSVSVFLVRILFLLFGDDTNMWKRTQNGMFADLVKTSPENGSSLGGTLQELFQALDTPIEKRPGTLSSALKEFPYVNGGLFKEPLPIFSFTPEMRAALAATNDYDWSKISPAIFGAMFQTIKSKENRRALGEHYTSESNILKVIGPLFLTDLSDRVRKSWETPSGLKKIHEELGALSFLDPACGSGNFLVVAYKRLRELELKIIARLKELGGESGQSQLDGTWGLKVHLGQFHGIECEEWSSQIATVAMFLADHQANLALEEITGAAPDRFPLLESAKIRHGNALTIDWSEVAKLDENTIIFGNPPFIGAKERSSEQSHDHDLVWQSYKGAGALDFVTCWFLIASQWIGSRKCKAAFVSTNSIAQGRQPDILWQGMNKYEVKIDFAYQSFRWENGEAGEAIVTCVIVGFSHKDHKTTPHLWIRGAAVNDPIQVSQINPYLVDGPMVTTPSRRVKISNQISPANYGSIGYDNGSFGLDHDQFLETVKAEPNIEKFLKRFIGGREMLYNEYRYCIWLGDAEPNEVKGSKFLQNRLAEVKAFREASSRAATNSLSRTPGIFGEIRQPMSSYVAVAKVSSEKRRYVPSAIFEKEVIASGSVITICSNQPYFDFAVVCSRAFAVWNEAVSGRMKTDFQVSVEITYNNFPFPEITHNLFEEISAAGEKVLAVRDLFPNSTLADLYDSLSMPERLFSAHNELDSLINKAFGLPARIGDAKLLSALFTQYESLISADHLK
jgi:type I restriction-modification system DNA methylase subunit